jgi:D-alanine transaminase
VLVYLDGQVLPLADARISPEDRGFLFGDGVYEAVFARRGRLLLWEPHLERLRRGLAAIRLSLAAPEALAAVAEDLLRRNELADGDATVYLQVTRGAAPRAHAFPGPEVAPTVYLATRRHQAHPAERLAAGVAAITLPDVRWSRCDIKAIGLLGSVLANQAAKEAGAFEALFVRNGVVTEGSHTNVFAVTAEGRLVTHVADHHILAGVTRAVVLELARDGGLAVDEAPLPLADLLACSELFVTGTSTEILPVTTLDRRAVGNGRPGPITRRLREAYLGRLAELAG